MALVASFISEWQTQTDMSWMASEGKEKRGRGRQDAAPSKLPALAKGKMASTESILAWFMPNARTADPSMSYWKDSRYDVQEQTILLKLTSSLTGHIGLRKACFTLMSAV